MRRRPPRPPRTYTPVPDPTLIRSDVADLRPVNQARGDHPPADSPLKTAKGEQADEAPAIAGWNGATRPEPEEREGKGQADDAAEQPVDIFPEIDFLELGQGQDRKSTRLNSSH